MLIENQPSGNRGLFLCQKSDYGPDVAVDPRRDKANFAPFVLSGLFFIRGKNLIRGDMCGNKINEGI